MRGTIEDSPAYEESQDTFFRDSLPLRIEEQKQYKKEALTQRNVPGGEMIPE